MIRYIWLSVCLLCTLSMQAQKPLFNVRFSEPLAVYIFVKHLSQNYGNNSFKQAYNSSTYANDKYGELLKDFDALSLDYSYTYTEFPYGSKTAGMTEQLLKKELIRSEGLAEFSAHAVGILPNKTLSRLSHILTEFTPVYKALIYQPNRKKFERQLKDISKFIEGKDVPTFFYQGLKFYNAEWNNSIPFEICFYPLPKSNGFTAEAFMNHAVSAIQTERLDYNVLLSVILHEIYHILYDEQSLEFKVEIEQYFNSNPALCSRYAKHLLNEALATALGNGFVFEKLSHSIDTGEWYHSPYINQMAKKVYPLVKSYMEEGKSIDKYFVDHYISLYEHNFPHWMHEADHIMSYRYILSNHVEDFLTMRKVFPMCSLSEAEDQIQVSSIERMRSTPLTKLVIISQDHAKQLELMENSFTELKALRLNPGEEFVHRVFLNDKTQLYLVNQYHTSTEEILNRLKAGAF